MFLISKVKVINKDVANTNKADLQKRSMPIANITCSYHFSLTRRKAVLQTAPSSNSSSSQEAPIPPRFKAPSCKSSQTCRRHIGCILKGHSFETSFIHGKKCTAARLCAAMMREALIWMVNAVKALPGFGQIILDPQ